MENHNKKFPLNPNFKGSIGGVRSMEHLQGDVTKSVLNPTNAKNF